MAKDKANPYKRWFRNFLLCSLVPLFFIALFNCLVDGSGLFRLDRELKYAAANLLDEKMVAGPLGGYDEREFQRLIVENYPKRRDVVLIGSSRSMLAQEVHRARYRFFQSFYGWDGFGGLRSYSWSLQK
jgi:hypothetical protein